jgi:hypothetical protein
MWGAQVVDIKSLKKKKRFEMFAGQAIGLGTQINILDPKLLVSRKHGQVTWAALDKDEYCYFTDLSTHGTFICIGSGNLKITPIKRIPLVRDVSFMVGDIFIKVDDLTIRETEVDGAMKAPFMKLKIEKKDFSTDKMVVELLEEVEIKEGTKIGAGMFEIPSDGMNVENNVWEIEKEVDGDKTSWFISHLGTDFGGWIKIPAGQRLQLAKGDYMRMGLQRVQVVKYPKMKGIIDYLAPRKPKLSDEVPVKDSPLEDRIKKLFVQAAEQFQVEEEAKAEIEAKEKKKAAERAKKRAEELAAQQKE